MKSAFFQNLSLQKKFILVMTIAVVILMVIIGFMVTKWERDIMYDDIERQGRILAETLAIPVMDDLTKNVLFGRLGLVEEGRMIGNYFSDIFENKDIDLISLVVLDENGRVIAHNDVDEYGKVYQDPKTLHALASDSTIVQRYHDNTVGHDALDIATPLMLGKKRWGTLKFAISLEKVDQKIHNTVVSAIIFTVVLLIVGLCIIVFFSRRFIRPITKLAETMEKAGGDMRDVEVVVRGKDEVASLGQSFNKMIDRIRESNTQLMQTHEKLLQFTRTIEKTSGDMLDVKVDINGKDEVASLGQSFNRMIDRIRESNIKLKETHEQLLHSQKLASLGILASGVAHEINNPLGGMFNCVQMLEQMGEDKNFRQKYLKLLKDGLIRIEDTVGKLLWMSRKKDKNIQTVEITQSLRDVYPFIEYRLVQNNITYNAQAEDGISVSIDPIDLQQVLINLMINAIQSMKDGGTLNINTFSQNSEVVLEISDTGEGIDKKNLHNIFDPFYTTKKPGEGTGLGLWLTYEIVKNYDGDIAVRSTKGEGTTFSITFKRVD
jgi:signal transduction histidine kinase